MSKGHGQWLFDNNSHILYHQIVMKIKDDYLIVVAFVCFSSISFGANAVWKGTVDSVWDTTTANWTVDGTPNSTYTDGDDVIFDDTALTNIVTGSGTRSPASVLVSNTVNYTISANIGGTGTTLTKKGSAELYLLGTNTYTGGTIIDDGTIGNMTGGYGFRDYTFGSGPITFTGSARISPNRSSYPTMPNPIVINQDASGEIYGTTFYYKSYLTEPLSGSGKFIRTGGNGVIDEYRSTSNSFTGILELAGTTATYRFNSLADSSSPIRLSGCKFELRGGSATPMVFNQRQIELNGNNTSTVYINNNNSAATNTITINTDLLITVNQAKTLELGGSNGGENIFAGVISNRSGSYLTKVNKAGSGKWILAGTNTYTGITAVNDGTLVLRGEESIDDSATINITSGLLDIETREKVGVLQTNGVVSVPATGTWGSTSSGAEFKNDTYFTGNGILYVGVDYPPPGTVLIIN
jgi:autotransporter-associated beta strand protein